MNKTAFKALKIGQVIYHTSRKNVDGSRLRARVNGKLKEWKDGTFRIPMKYGFSECFYISDRADLKACTLPLYRNPDNWAEDDN